MLSPRYTEGNECASFLTKINIISTGGWTNGPHKQSKYKKKITFIADVCFLTQEQFLKNYHQIGV